MNVAAEVVRLRNEDPSRTLLEIALVLDVPRDRVAQIIAKKRKKGVFVAKGTSTSKGHTWKFSRKRKRTNQ